MATMMVRGERERGQMAEKDGNVFDSEREGGWLVLAWVAVWRAEERKTSRENCCSILPRTQR